MEPRAGLHLLALLALLAAPAGARVLLAQREALALAFPPGTAVERRTAYLTEDERLRAQAAARAKVESGVWTYYVGRSSAGPQGYAYFETHVVRTMTETVMAVVEPGGRLRSVELLAFAEPDDYRPTPRWLGQFEGRGEGGELFVGRALRNMTGATLTSHALSDSVRRVLAVHEVIQSRDRAR